MAALLADALLQGARTAREFLTPATVLATAHELAQTATPTASLTQELQARIEAARDETLEYHRTHRPSNTVRNYAPKQREWKAWCAAQGFPSSGQYLPGDWVDEGKLLLFIKEEVAARALRTRESGRRRPKASRRSRRSAAKAQVALALALVLVLT